MQQEPTPPAEAVVPDDVRGKFLWLANRPRTAQLITLRDKASGQPRYFTFNVEQTPDDAGSGVARFYLLAEVFTDERSKELLAAVEPYPDTLEVVPRENVPDVFKEPS